LIPRTPSRQEIKCQITPINEQQERGRNKDKKVIYKTTASLSLKGGIPVPFNQTANQMA